MNYGSTEAKSQGATGTWRWRTDRFADPENAPPTEPAGDQRSRWSEHDKRSHDTAGCADACRRFVASLLILNPDGSGHFVQRVRAHDARLVHPVEAIQLVLTSGCGPGGTEQQQGRLFGVEARSGARRNRLWLHSTAWSTQCRFTQDQGYSESSPAKCSSARTCTAPCPNRRHSRATSCGFTPENASSGRRTALQAWRRFRATGAANQD